MASNCKRFGRAGALLLGLGFCALAQQADSGSWLAVELPRDSPVLLVSSSLGGTTARPRGTSMAVDLHASLLLRNTGNKALSGLTLRVEAQDLTPSGRGSVTVPSMEIQPGEVFPVRIDMELLQAVHPSEGGRGARAGIARLRAVQRFVGLWTG